MAYTIRPRYGTTAGYAALNRVYDAGELLCELGVDGLVRMKVADGTTSYNSLPYVVGGEGSGSLPAFGTISVPGQSNVVADAPGATATMIGSSGIALTTNAGTDTLTFAPQYGTTANTICQGNDARLSGGGTPAAHATTHGAGGTDIIKLDDLGAPDDNTDLNASTSAHGLLRKLSGNAGDVLLGTGAWSPPPGASGVISVVTYGAIGDGAADDTSAITAAIAAMPASGGSLYFPTGVYRVTSAITIDKPGRYFGDGVSTIITSSVASIDVFICTAQSVTIDSIGFKTTVTRTNGSYVVLSGPNSTLSRFTMQGAFVGVWINAVAIITVESGEIRECVASTGRGIVVDTGFDVSIRDISMDSAPNIESCILVISAGDVTIEDCQLIHGAYGLKIAPGAGKSVASVWCNNTFFDNCGSNGLIIVPSGSGAAVVRCLFDQCWFSSSGSHGVLLQTASGGSIDGIDLTGCHIFLNADDGVHVSDTGTHNIRISDSAFAQNGGAGVSLGASNIADFSVTSCRAGNTHGLSGNAYGIYVSSGCSGYIITSNDLRGNSLANIADSGTTPKVVANNLT